MARRKNGSSDWAQLTCARQVAAAGRHLLSLLDAAIVSLTTDPPPVLSSQNIAPCVDAARHFFYIIEAARFDAPLARSCVSHLKWLHRELSNWNRPLSVNDRQNAIGILRDLSDSLNGLVSAAEGIRCDPDQGALQESVNDEPQSQVDFGSPEFNILVLGDMHLGAPDQVAAWDNMRFKFLDDLEYLERKLDLEDQWDLVAFVGDMSYRGEEAEFDRVDQFVEELWNRWEGKGWHPKLVAVPGNHDLVRPARQTGSLDSLLRFEPFVETALFGEQTDEEFRPIISACFEHYEAWRSRQEVRWPDGACPGNMPGEFAASISGRNGKRLGIMGLNSAFLHLKDCSKSSPHLCVSEHQFHRAGGAGWCREQDICLLLTHHPAEWLRPSCRDTFHSSIFSTDHFGLHVCGHLHGARSRSFSTQGLRNREVVINSSLFGRKSFGRSNKKRIHGYSVVQLLTKESKWRYRLWPRTANEKLEWKLIPDGDFDIHYPSEGTLPRQLPTPRCP